MKLKSRLPQNEYFLSPGKIPLLLCLFVLALDQATKMFVANAWPEGYQKVVIRGFFNLVHFRNPGAAWGIFGEHTEILAVFSLVVFVFFFINFRKFTENVSERALALGVILGGILGNFIDRACRGEVIDFLFFFWRDVWQYPAFNIADTAITCGVALFIFSSILQESGKKQSKK